MQERIWYIQVADAEEGPYSVLDLKADERITPETLVWREGFPEWVPIGSVEELREVFTDDVTSASEEVDSPDDTLPVPDEVVIVSTAGGPSFNFWFIIAILIVIYLILLFSYA